MKTAAGIVLLAVAFLWSGPLGSLQAQQNETLYDKDIKVVDFVELSYPPLGRTAHIEGVVVVRVRLDDHGEVLNAVAISGSDILIPDCLANVKKWRFRPNAQNAAVIVYNFRMIAGTSVSEISQFSFQRPNLATITADLPSIR